MSKAKSKRPAPEEALTLEERERRAHAAGWAMAEAVEAFLRDNYPASPNAVLLLDPGHNLPVLAVAVRGHVPQGGCFVEGEIHVNYDYHAASEPAAEGGAK